MQPTAYRMGSDLFTNRNVEQNAHFYAGLHICSSLVLLLLCLINKLENVALNFITIWHPCRAIMQVLWLNPVWFPLPDTDSCSAPFAILLAPCATCSHCLWERTALGLPSSTKGRFIFSPHTVFFSKHLRQKMINNSKTFIPKAQPCFCPQRVFCARRDEPKRIFLYTGVCNYLWFHNSVLSLSG